MLTGSVYTEQNVGVDAYGQVWDAVEPDGELSSPGLKFCCTIWLAVRLEKALPSEDR